MALAEAGISLYAGVSGNADDAVDALIAGTLEAGSEANCDHHDHEHGEGHSCGHGRCHEQFPEGMFRFEKKMER